jgi:hypothetical protein
MKERVFAILILLALALVAYGILRWHFRLAFNE